MEDLDLHVGQLITIDHLAWRIISGPILTLHRDGKSGTMATKLPDGSTGRVAFRASDLVTEIVCLNCRAHGAPDKCWQCGRKKSPGAGFRWSWS